LKKKKIVLPTVLVFLLLFVLSLNAIYYEQLSKDTSDLAGNALEGIRLTIYNGTLNGTEPSIESQLIAIRQNEQEMQNKQSSLRLINGLSSLVEYVLNVFGTNFCAVIILDHGYIANNRKECVSTELEASVGFEISRLITCASDFSRYFTNFINTNANSTDWRVFEESPEGQKMLRDFILSEKGQNIFNYLEGCTYSKDDFLDPQKQKERMQKYLPWEQKSATFRVINAFDVISYFLILIIVGYLINCIIIYVHRRNEAFVHNGKKAYMLLAFFFVVFLMWSVMLGIYSNDIIIRFFFVISFSYIVTTLVFMFVDILEEDRLEKKVSRSRKK